MYGNTNYTVMRTWAKDKFKENIIAAIPLNLFII